VDMKVRIRLIQVMKRDAIHITDILDESPVYSRLLE